MIQVRKLVAVELTFLGFKIVFAEYGFAVLVGAAIGLLSLRVGLLRTHAAWQVLLGIYLLFLALTYAVLWDWRSQWHPAVMPAKKSPASCTAYPLRFKNTADDRSGSSLVVPLAALRQR